MELICFSYMSKISIWYSLIHDELLENCYEKNGHKSIHNKVDIALSTEHLESQSF